MALLLLLVLVEEVAVVGVQHVRSQTYHQVVVGLPLPYFNRKKTRWLLIDSFSILIGGRTTSPRY
jgi:hypothetical protein